MHTQTKVILRGRTVKHQAVRCRKGVRQVLHLIFAVENHFLHHNGHEGAWCPVGVTLREIISRDLIKRPVFVAESIDPVLWARKTRSQGKRRRIALWLKQRASEGASPRLTVLEEIWVPKGTRRSKRLTWWVRKLQPTLQGPLTGPGKGT